MIDVGHTLKFVLFIALAMLSAIFTFWWVRSARDQRALKQLRNDSEPSGAPTAARLAIGFGTNFSGHAGYRIVCDHNGGL